MGKKIIRAIAIIMICCVSFLFVGCDDEDEEGGGGSNSTYNYIPMYGTKVLYRPSSYDFNAGSGGTEEDPNDYYGEYAYRILQYLSDVYGITNSTFVNDGNDLTKDDILPEFNITEGIDGTGYIPYLYDSIRYRVNIDGNVTSKKVDGVLETNKPFTPYYIVGADTNTHWNWYFDYAPNILNDVNIKAYLAALSPIEDGYNNIYSTYNSMIFNAYYNSDYTSNYNKIFLGTTKFISSKLSSPQFSDFVKALEYVIYSYSLDLEPHPIIVRINENVTNEHPEYYTVYVTGYADVDEALEDIKATFNRIGSFVGLMQRQITQITNWIRTNIIGVDENNDLFKSYKNVTALYETQADNSEVLVGYEFDESSVNTTTLGRNYTQAVENIVKKVCIEVSIGQESGGGDVTIDDRFLASEMIEYNGSASFFASDRKMVPDNKVALGSRIRPLEYQSAAFMFKGTTYISDIIIALKYDADDDGTQKMVWNQDKYIDIILELNYYNHKANKYITIGSKQTRVYDGPYDFGISSTDESYPDFIRKAEDHGNVMFTMSDSKEAAPYMEKYEDADCLVVNSFNPNVGNGILKTDIWNGDVTYDPQKTRRYYSQNPLILKGTTDVRKYYSIVEPQIDENLGNYTYVTGRLNPEKFAGTDGCDYLEVTYKVLKEKGNTTKNYKFYTGITFIFSGGGDFDIDESDFDDEDFEEPKM